MQIKSPTWLEHNASGKNALVLVQDGLLHEATAQFHHPERNSLAMAEAYVPEFSKTYLGEQRVLLRQNTLSKSPQFLVIKI